MREVTPELLRKLARRGVLGLAASWLLYVPVASAQFTILYSGTFDPFHRAHLEEVEGALREFPGSTALVMPIQRAPHTPYIREADAYQPTFLRYEETTALIAASVTENPLLRVDSSFRYLGGENSAEALARATGALTESRRAHLVGTDILAVWERKGALETILSTASIIVAEDPSDLDSYRLFSARYGSDPRFRFIRVVTSTVRATEVRLSSISGDPLAWLQYLAPSAIREIRAGRLRVGASGERYLREMRVFASHFYRHRLVPRLLSLGVPVEVLSTLDGSELDQIRLMNYLYERLVARTEGRAFADFPGRAQIDLVLRGLPLGSALETVLLDGARTIKTVRSVATASTSVGVASSRCLSLTATADALRPRTPGPRSE